MRELPEWSCTITYDEPIPDDRLVDLVDVLTPLRIGAVAFAAEDGDTFGLRLNVWARTAAEAVDRAQYLADLACHAVRLPTYPVMAVAAEQARAATPRRP